MNRIRDIGADKLVPPALNRRQVLSGVVAAVVGLAVTRHAPAQPAAAVAIEGIEGSLGQICVFDTDGESFCYWPDDAKLDAFNEPRELDATGPVWVGESTPEIIWLPNGMQVGV